MRQAQTIIILACSALAIGQLVLARHSSLSEWTLYKKQHGKVYEEPEEDARRFSLFLAAKDRIAKHNGNASFSYKLGLNHLSDWTQEELNKLTGTFKDPNEHQHEQLIRAMAPSILKSSTSNLSESPSSVRLWQFDWRLVPGRVSEVKDQGECGSSWAFATVGVLEGQQLVRNVSVAGGLKPLSVQQLIDCSESNDGCNGGRVSLALEDIAQMGGIESEQDYSYSAKRHRKCIFTKSKSVMTDTGYQHVGGKRDGSELLKTLGTFGPVAVGFEVTSNFYAYKSGIFQDDNCTGFKINHHLLIVGYGADNDNGAFWVAKNSWGKDWGDGGYVRIRRDWLPDCSITLEPIIPSF